MNEQSFYSHPNYKVAVKSQLQILKKKKSHYTLKKISEMLPVQYTFLSKVLNSEDGNLNEDHVFKLGKIFELSSDEIDFLLLLRSLNVTQDSERKNFLIKKIEKIRKEKVVSAHFVTEQKQNIDYLLNPLCVIVHTALFVPTIKENPRSLCSLLGITNDKLKKCLSVLEKNGFIELAESPYQIKNIVNQRYHYSAEHPLMRLHQQMLKTQLIQRLSTTDEENKDSFFVTFNADLESFEKIKIRFREFIKDIEQIAQKSKDKNLYQLNFDLLRWF